MNWHRVLAADELPDGRVTTVAAGHKSVALVHYDGQFSALDNRCPHQGGPLGEGSIENGLLRCPWHGFDDCPLDGSSPGIEDEARQDQQGAAGGGVGRLADALHNPDFSAFARNCGAFGVRITDRAQLDQALAEAVAYNGPAMVEVMTDPNLV